MVFNTTYNNISAISWRSILLVEETRVLRENHSLFASPVTDKLLSHNVVSRTPCHQLDLNLQLQWRKAWIAQVALNPTTI